MPAKRQASWQALSHLGLAVLGMHSMLDGALAAHVGSDRLDIARILLPLLLRSGHLSTPIIHMETCSGRKKCYCA